MYKFTIKKLLSVLFLCQLGFSAAVIQAPAKLYYPAILTFDGPSVDESETTFRNYRLDVTFTKGTKSYKVPGYFAADGNASETSASSGNKWRVKFTPDEAGVWNYTVSFRTGTDVAVSSVATAGTAVANVDGETGTFTVGDYDKSAPGFHGKGILQYVGEHYPRFSGSGEWFIKTGPGSPEDFFGYKDFDNTVDNPTHDPKQSTQNFDAYLKTLNGESLHFYTAHVKDWMPGDVTWKNGLGKGIVGALNYQASLGCNNQYMITLTRGDDSDDCWPWTSRDVTMQYDVSKLEQWDCVFAHMDKVGIVPHIYLTEAMNTTYLDNGDMTLKYPIYYREIIARFGYHLGIRYSIGEEPAPAFTSTQKAAAAARLRNLDVYNHALPPRDLGIQNQACV